MQRADLIRGIIGNQAEVIKVAHEKIAEFDFTEDELKELVDVTSTYNHTKLLIALINQKKFDVNTKFSHGRTLLHKSARVGNLEVVKFLLANNALQIHDAEGNYPAHVAIESKNDFLLPTLLQNIQNPDQFTNQKQQTLFEFALLNDSLITASWLKEKKNTDFKKLMLRAVKTNDIPTLQRLDKINCTFDIKENEKGLIAIAAEFNQEHSLHWLYKVKNISFDTTHAQNPMRIAIEFQSFRVLETLLRLDPEFAMKKIAGQDYYPVHFAAYLGNLTALKLFERYCPAALQLKGEYNSSLIHYAAEKGNIETIKWLYRIDFDLFLKNDSGNDPLQLAVQYDQVTVAKFIVSKAGTHSLRNRLPALMLFAANFDSAKIVEWINEDINVSINFRDREGDVFDHALTHYSFKVLKYLFEENKNFKINSDIIEKICSFIMKHRFQAKPSHETKEYLFQILIEYINKERIVCNKTEWTNKVHRNLIDYYQKIDNLFEKYFDFLIHASAKLGKLQDTLNFFKKKITTNLSTNQYPYECLYNKLYENSCTMLLENSDEANFDIIFNFFSEIEFERTWHLTLDILIKLEKVDKIISICFELIKKGDQSEIARITLADLLLSGRVTIPEPENSPLNHFKFNRSLITAFQAHYILQECKSKAAMQLKDTFNSMLTTSANDQIPVTALNQEDIISQDEDANAVFLFNRQFKEHSEDKFIVESVNKQCKRIATRWEERVEKQKLLAQKIRDELEAEKARQMQAQSLLDKSNEALKIENVALPSDTKSFDESEKLTDAQSSLKSETIESIQSDHKTITKKKKKLQGNSDQETDHYQSVIMTDNYLDLQKQKTEEQNKIKSRYLMFFNPEELHVISNEKNSLDENSYKLK